MSKGNEQEGVNLAWGMHCKITVSMMECLSRADMLHARLLSKYQKTWDTR